MRDFKTVIEFGTSKISCTVAEKKQRMGLEVLGYAQVPYEGIKNSKWVEPKNVIYALEHALEACERQTGTRIRNADVGIPGSFINVINQNAQVPVKGRVTEKDVDLLIEKARRFDFPEDLTLVHEWPAWFLMDDDNIYLDPYDIPTKRLRGCISFTFANKFFLKDVMDLLNHLGVRVDYFIPEPLAEALYLLPAEKRDAIAAIIDIGYYSTNISLVYGDSLLHFTTIPMGGGHITHDIAYAMKVDDETAEQLKRRYTFGLSDNNSISQLFAKGSDGKLKKYPYDLLKEIIDARVEHLILYICKLLNKSEISVSRKINMYLTGGGLAFMKGSDSFFRAVSGRTPTLIRVQNTKLQPPDMHSAYALMQYAYDGYIQSKSPARRKGLFGRGQDVLFE
ncbi:cell division protein FtsA [Christensenella hongkongensis]|uniref:cell division protein FtsA n=1 Tax=Christensenella hongkongensis TaxID=270498 RepID=UPI0026720993|nr:cell division FtsA domain-containing protein [Christensenella hongkongensis]